MHQSPFDPIERSSEIENIVMRNSSRRYYRFRHSGHYGGIVTADAVGCNLLCAYCWNYQRNQLPGSYGSYYTPEKVAEKLLKISSKKGISLFRISGAEPVLGRRSMEHLVEIVKLIDSRFVLETNGLILGHMPELADMLRGLDISVRVAVKGWDERSFERITGALGKAFWYQLTAVSELSRREVDVWPAVMYDIFGKEGLEQIENLLREIGVSKVEREDLERYPFVMNNLRKRGIALQS